MNDDLPPQRIARLTPVAQVLDRIDVLVQPVVPREVPVREAAGRVLAADIVAPHDLPANALALRDGYAVAADDTMDAGGYAPVRLTQPPRRVDAGDPLPTGTDAVAPPDVVAARDGAHEILAQVAPGDGVLAAQGDIRAGTVLLKAGARLRAIDLAVLALAGIERVPVRLPRVRVVSASETTDAVLDAAAAMIARLLAADGADVVATDLTRGDLAAALDAPDTNAIVVIGGSGLGPTDRSVHTLAKAGRVGAHGIAISPGETTAFGQVGSLPVLVLQGRIDAALAVWLVLGRQILARLCASPVPEHAFAARLTRKVASGLGLTEVIPVQMRDGGAEPIASGYLPWSSLAQADGWILIPADSEGYPPGAEVMIRPMP